MASVGSALSPRRGRQGANDGDLVALVRDRFLCEHDPGAMLHGGHEVVLGAGVVARGTADALAVDGHGLVARLLRGPRARGAVEHLGVKRHEDLEERGRRRRGETPQGTAVEGSKGAELVLGQSLGELGERRHAVVPGELRGGRDGQDRGQRIAPSAGAPELRHGAKTLPRTLQPVRAAAMKALAIVLLVLASTAASAEDCPTDETKMVAISDFIYEHHGSAFTMISSAPEDPALFEVDFWPYNPAGECSGAARVSDECEVSEEQALVCS